MAKRPYDGEAGPPYTRLSLADESTKLFRKANILYWSKALLNMTYNYIHNCISEATDPPLLRLDRVGTGVDLTDREIALRVVL